MFYHGFRTWWYDGLKGPLFSSMVSSEGFSEFEIVLGSVKQFSEVLNSSQKCQTVFGSVKQFSEVSNSSRKSQTVLGSFKQFSEVSNSSRKAQTVLRSLKQFSEKSQTVLGSLKQFSEVSTVLREVSNSSRDLRQFSAVSNCPRTLKQLLVFGDTFCDLVILLTVIKLVLILLTLKGWKAESTLEPPSGFEHGTPGLEIQHLNH